MKTMKREAVFRREEERKPENSKKAERLGYCRESLSKL